MWWWCHAARLLMDVDALVLRPYLELRCGCGHGLAVSERRRLIVTSAIRGPSDLDFYILSEGGWTITPAGTLSDPQFWFGEADLSGGLAFAGEDEEDAGASSALLLVADACHSSVHIVDAVERRHVGFVGGAGATVGARRVAAKGALVAVSCLLDCDGSPAVRAFRGRGCAWAPLWTVDGRVGGTMPDGKLLLPAGLRFTPDGTGLVVVDSYGGRVLRFRVADGTFERTVVADLWSGICGVRDLEECTIGGKDGWLLLHERYLSVARDTGGILGPELRWFSDRLVRSHPVTAVRIPGIGLAVREFNTLIVLATTDAIAMARMSVARVAWMTACVRGTLLRRNTGRTRTASQEMGTG